MITAWVAAVADGLGALMIGSLVSLLIMGKSRKPFGLKRIIESWKPTVRRAKKLAKARAKAQREREIAERAARDERRRVYEEAKEAARQLTQNNMVRRQEARNHWIQDFIDAGGTKKELGIILPAAPPREAPKDVMTHQKKKPSKKSNEYDYDGYYTVNGETMVYNPKTGEWRY